MIRSLTKEKDQIKKELGKDKIIKITCIQYLIDFHHHQSIIQKAQEILDSIQIFFIHHPKGQLDLHHPY